MKSWIILLAGAAGSWRFLDLESENSFFSQFLPFCFIVFLILLAGRVAFWLGPSKGRGGDGGGFDFFDGGDGGGGD